MNKFEWHKDPSATILDPEIKEKFMTAAVKLWFTEDGDENPEGRIIFSHLNLQNYLVTGRGSASAETMSSYQQSQEEATKFLTTDELQSFLTGLTAREGFNHL